MSLLFTELSYLLAKAFSAISRKLQKLPFHNSSADELLFRKEVLC
jgi:hypothetical protein